jgi:small subunit ribosomal protein S17
MEHTPRHQSFVGTVVKTAMKDTATVKVDRYVQNVKYKKFFTRSKKYLAHDPGNTAEIGDTVTIVATRPISKMKRFAIDPSKTIKKAATEN